MSDWKTYLDQLPIKITDLILDLGCGAGVVTALLAVRCAQVIGIDQNTPAKNSMFIKADLKSLDNERLPMADGIWCSFTAAYFPDFEPVLTNWLQFLKPGGWIALVEVDDLFGHHPLSSETRAIIKAHYQRLREQGIYDFEMGRKLKSFLPITILFEKDMTDKELAFDGPAEEQVLVSWENRLDRMAFFRNSPIKKEFLQCLKNSKHHCTAKVKFVLAIK